MKMPMVILRFSRKTAPRVVQLIIGKQGKEQSVHFINLHVMVTKWAKYCYKQTFLRAAVSAQVLDKACKVYRGRY